MMRVLLFLVAVQLFVPNVALTQETPDDPGDPVDRAGRAGFGTGETSWDCSRIVLGRVQHRVLRPRCIDLVSDPDSYEGEDFTDTIETECKTILDVAGELESTLDSDVTKKLQPGPLVDLERARKRCAEILPLSHEERVERIEEEGFSRDHYKATYGIAEPAREFESMSRAYMGIVEVKDEVDEIVSIQREDGLIDDEEYTRVRAQAKRCEDLAWKSMFGTFAGERIDIGDARVCIDSVKAERIARSKELTGFSLRSGYLWYIFLLLALLPVGVGYLWWKRSSDNEVELEP